MTARIIPYMRRRSDVEFNRRRMDLLTVYWAWMLAPLAFMFAPYLDEEGE